MKTLKVCFVGVGSIAKRHIRNLRAICDGRGISLQVDAYRHSVASGGAEGVENTYFSLDNVPSDYDVIFITNPTEQHLSTLQAFHEKGRHFFIEKPAVSVHQIEAAKCMNFKNDAVYYVAAPLRYNAVIRYIKEHVDLADVVSVRCISSSYLPDWRPGQDYRRTYSAHKSMGGGVSIDLIHEWDYLSDLFGWPERMMHMIGKKSDLEIDSDDYAIYIAEYERCIAELHLDYFGRKAIREIQLFTKDDTIIGDLSANQIRFLKEDKIIAFGEERDDYQRRELEYFLNLISGQVVCDNGFLHGLHVLELTQGRV